MSEARDKLTVALWATDLSTPLRDLDEWAALVERRMREAARAGAALLAMPEYAAEQWLSFAPAGLGPRDEIPWLAAQAEAALHAIGGLPARHGVALLAGTMPFPIAAGRHGAPPYVNRAHLLLPDGACLAQDKLCLTPPERDPRGWHLSTGEEVRVLDWCGLRLAVLVCLDVELPALAARLAGWDLDLLLVPSMTEKLSGYSRVSGCARARAVELEAAVAVVGCVGSAAASKPRESNTGGAAVYVPCEPALGHTGELLRTPPLDRAPEDDALAVTEIPTGAIRRLRRGGADVWPGAWSAEHITVRAV